MPLTKNQKATSDRNGTKPKPKHVKVDLKDDENESNNQTKESPNKSDHQRTHTIMTEEIDSQNISCIPDVPSLSEPTFINKTATEIQNIRNQWSQLDTSIEKAAQFYDTQTTTSNKLAYERFKALGELREFNIRRRALNAIRDECSGIEAALETAFVSLIRESGPPVVEESRRIIRAKRIRDYAEYVVVHERLPVSVGMD